MSQLTRVHDLVYVHNYGIEQETKQMKDKHKTEKTTRNHLLRTYVRSFALCYNLAITDDRQMHVRDT